MFRAIRETYHHTIAVLDKEVTFWVLIAFLPTFAIARALVYLTPQLFLHVGHAHIHHFTYGIILLAISGYLGLVVSQPRVRLAIAALYGIGLALAFDEFGMWLHLADDYWVRQSYDAIFLIVGLLILILYFANFWGKLAQRLVGATKQASKPPTASE